ncbi:MAG: arginine--tRNA ligase [Pseudomonadota bacterium]
MRTHIRDLLTRAVAELQGTGMLPAGAVPDIHLERTRDKAHGDFACNLAMTLAKLARRKPRELAEALVQRLPDSPKVAKVEIAGPGFINFYIAPHAFHAVIGEILEAREAYGHSSIGAGKRVQVEFVSANPTGPLHVGHGRGAAYGAAVADLLAATGFSVHREYYVNDAGRQMDILAASVWMRYLELLGEVFPFPANAYKGAYVKDIAAALRKSQGERLRRDAAQLMRGLPPDEGQPDGDKERHIDARIERAKQLLGDADYRVVFDAGLNSILDDIRDDLAEFGVVYEQWYSERSLADTGAIQRALTRLRASDYVYEKDGALWFKSTAFGDEKDRVVVRENGQTTYFASDIAYHLEKFARGFDRVVDVWGADHHGYVPRVKAALTAMGTDASKLDVLLVQFAILYRGQERVQMSTRSGEFVTLRELRDEVGNDAARFFYVMRKAEQHLDFDLDLAKSQSNDNPVYYIQYAHARVSSVMRQLQEKGFTRAIALGLENVHRLHEDHEQALMVSLSRFPEVVENAALAHEPHQLCYFLRDLANEFHTYYNAHTFIVDDAALRDARLNLIAATAQVIATGLGFLGVAAPETM